SKYYGVPILMGDNLAQQLGDFAVLPVDRVRVVGRTKGETVHVLLGDQQVRDSADFIDFAAAHRAMLDAYFRQRWDQAAEINDRNEQQSTTFGLARLVMLYRERIIAFAATPPADGWDGVYEPGSK
ncbi:MAG: hypothetical protein ABIR25_08145, partial [Sphingomicrobium sp.]